jgi:PAS domain S-box-containing protein
MHASSPSAKAPSAPVLESDPQAILESITDAFFALSPDWQFIYVNRQAEALLNRQPGDLLGKTLWDEYPDVGGNEFGKTYLRVASERVAASVTAYYPEHERWYEARAYPAPYGISVYFNDVSRSRQADGGVPHWAADPDTQRRVYETALSNSPDFNYVFDLEGRFTYVNKALLDLWQKDLSEAMGKNFFELDYPEELAARLQAQIKHTAETRETVRDETPYTSAFGTRAYEYIFVPVTDASGTVVAVSGSTRDITERKQAEEALRDQDRRKDEFLATLAHELRNPLAPLRNGVEIIRLAYGKPELVDPACNLMERQLNHMVRLIDDLMDASRMSRGKVELRLERVDLAQTVQLALETVRPLAEQSSHQLEVDLPAERIVVNGDPTRLAQVFANLLNNAVKFTPQHGKIRLSARIDDGHVTVSVSDNGSGIAPEDQSVVFEMFTHGTGSGRRVVGGLGIGLSMVKGLVELHEGEVTVHSAGPGQGSEFSVRLPLAEPHAPAQEAGQTASNDAQAARRKVLVVDDNEDAASSMAELLELMGHEVQMAHDGVDALAVAASFQPDVIFLDIGMPRMNGHEAARHIRQAPWGRDIALVALTGWGNARDREESRAAGFDHHLVKPGSFDEIETIIGRAAQANRPE